MYICIHMCIHIYIYIYIGERKVMSNMMTNKCVKCVECLQTVKTSTDTDEL